MIECKYSLSWSILQVSSRTLFKTRMSWRFKHRPVPPTQSKFGLIASTNSIQNFQASKMMRETDTFHSLTNRYVISLSHFNLLRRSDIFLLLPFRLLMRALNFNFEAWHVFGSLQLRFAVVELAEKSQARSTIRASL